MAYRYSDKRVYDPLFQNDPNRVDEQLDVVDNVTDAMKGTYQPRFMGVPQSYVFNLVDNTGSGFPTYIEGSYRNSIYDGVDYITDAINYSHGRDIITHFSLVTTATQAPVTCNINTRIDITKSKEWTGLITGARVNGPDLLLTVPSHGFPANLDSAGFYYGTRTQVETANCSGVEVIVVNANTLSLSGAAALYNTVFNASGTMIGYYVFFRGFIQLQIADLSTQSINIQYHVGKSDSPYLYITD